MLAPDTPCSILARNNFLNEELSHKASGAYPKYPITVAYPMIYQIHFSSVIVKQGSELQTVSYSHGLVAPGKSDGTLRCLCDLKPIVRISNHNVQVVA